MSMPVTWAIAI